MGGSIRSTTNIWSEGSGRFDEGVGIGSSALPLYRLYVNNGHRYFDGNINTTGNTVMGGTLDVSGTLNLAGDGIVNNNFRVDGRVGINGPTNASYGLIVNNSNSRFGGNVEVTGQVNTASMSVDALSIAGKGSVRSDGLSPLRMGFASKFVDVVTPGEATVEYTVNITDFVGDNDDIRVMVSQFAPAAGGGILAFERCIISVTEVNATHDTCKIKIHNTVGQLTVKGTIYLMCVAKN